MVLGLGLHLEAGSGPSLATQPPEEPAMRDVRLALDPQCPGPLSADLSTPQLAT